MAVIGDLVEAAGVEDPVTVGVEEGEGAAVDEVTTRDHDGDVGRKEVEEVGSMDTEVEGVGEHEDIVS